MNKYSFIVLFGLITASACVKDKPNPESHGLPNASHHGLLISNEGAYGNNNSELSFLDKDTKTMFNQLYSTANDRSLGDVVQSISLMNNALYVAVNNSNKIVVLDPNTYEEITTIHSVKSPRYITQVNTDKAYISSLYFPSVYVLDLHTNKIIKTITVDYPNTEKMIVQNGYCYVTNWDTTSPLIYKINTDQDSIEKRIPINGRASHGIVEDKNGWLWILSGNKYKQKSSQLTLYDPVSDQIIKTFAFNADEDPFRLTINATRDTLYYINVDYNGSSAANGLYKMSMTETQLPAAPFIQAQPNSYFWALGIDSITHHIFLADPKGFTQQSTVYEYSNTGNLLQQYTTGIGTNGFLFK